MGGEDEGAAGFGFEDVVDDLLAGLVVEAGEGFVHEEEVGGGEDSAHCFTRNDVKMMRDSSTAL